MYYNPNKQNHLDFKSKLYISRKLGYTQDEHLNQVVEYEEPKLYRFNVMPISADSEIREFGELAKSMKVAVITEKTKYINKFNEFDLAYLDGVTPDNELAYGDNANYRIYAIRNQNTIIRIYFIKRVINNQ